MSREYVLARCVSRLAIAPQKSKTDPEIILQLVPSGLWLITKSQRTPSGLSLLSILVLLRVRPSPLAGILRMSTKGAILGTSLSTRTGT